MTSAANAALRAAKHAVRVELKKRLALMSHEEKLRQSNLVTEKLFLNERFKGSRRVSIYLSIDQEIRIQTAGILNHIFNDGKECFVPKFTPNSHDVAMLKLHSLEDYAKLLVEKWDIKPPTEEDMNREEALSTGGLDLMIVPGLAFTRRGHRIGGGKGYYDAFVQRCSHDPHGRPYTIGLAFIEQILHSIPVDEHDFMVDEVIFPDS